MFRKKKPLFTVETHRYVGRIRIHDEADCSALQGDPSVYCVFDRPSEHKMNNWPLLIRTDAFSAGLVERICKHGVAHPDPDSVAYMNSVTDSGEWGVHGCDSCCG